MRVHFVRHGHHREVGHVLSGRSEIALDPSGDRQAGGLATLLAGVRYSAIYSSPRRRCIQTAGAIAAASGSAVMPALDELDFGSFSGRSFDELQDDPQWRLWNAERGTARCPDGETMGEAVARGMTFLHSQTHDEGALLCVTHCDLIRGIVAAALDIPFAKMFSLPCDPGSLTILDLGAAALRLVALNIVPSQVADQ